MGVCTEERPVMHWQQSARFLGPTTTNKQSITNPASLGNRTFYGSNNNQISLTYPENNCEQSKNFGTNLNFNDSCRRNNNNDVERNKIDESFIVCSHVSNSSGNNEYSEIVKHINSNIPLKIEPSGPPSSPESSSENLSEPDICGGCGHCIQDRFYLSAVEKRWHASCLQCCVCHQPLDGETSCFSRDDNIYCKYDYYRVFGARRCSRCLASISSSELVMRVRNLVFHVSCFACTVCNSPLTKGDQFGLRDSSIFCRLHYDILDEQTETSTPLSSSWSFIRQFRRSSDGSSSPADSNKIATNKFYSPSVHALAGLSQHARQKGRPRKRKPKDLDAMTSNIDLSTEYLDFGPDAHLSVSSRTKRMRTSFKHHQLRTMKSYFAINHNPDAKDLKQLSQKTGLPKRVLQVWFQNARAKWRRMMMKQDSKNVNDKSDGQPDLDSYSVHSPTFMLRGPSSPNLME